MFQNLILLDVVHVVLDIIQVLVLNALVVVQVATPINRIHFSTLTIIIFIIYLSFTRANVVCLPCPMGKSSFPSSGSCYECPTGSAGIHAGECWACDEGFYAPTTGLF